jgi:glycosyltransferase involved in cell wall biosynthesis
MLYAPEKRSGLTELGPIRNRPTSIYLPQVELFDGGHLNLVVPSMTRGGAERCVRDVAQALQGRLRSGKLFVMGQVGEAFPVDDLKSFEIIRPKGVDRAARLRRVAVEILCSPNPSAITHIIRSSDLRQLWRYGVKTIPVVHNSSHGWHDAPSEYRNEHVPMVIAVCVDVANQLKAAGLDASVSVLKHEVFAREGLKFDSAMRERIRRRYRIDESVLLIGMVGQFKAHKSYVRAVRVLAELRKTFEAKLMILGGWDHAYGAGRAAHAATLRQAIDLGVEADLLCLGSVENVEDYYSAFDVFLNTSIYEGMSIATLEAARTGCPIVTADVGGQREAITASDRLVTDPSDIEAYAAAIADLRKRDRIAPSESSQHDLIPRLWGWIAEFGQLKADSSASLADVLFVTSNLNPGGAQRSLTNLLTTNGWTIRPWLCILDKVLGDEFLSQLEKESSVPCVTLSHAGNLMTRVGSFLALARRVGARTICFWNVDPFFKLLVAKVLEHSPIRLVDVSPGPMLFEELDATAGLQRRIALSSEDYMRRQDVLVSKYKGGIPENAKPRRAVVISNGVAERPARMPVDSSLLPADADQRYALVTCCRLVPNKRLEWVVDLMSCLAERWPAATLTIVGGLDHRHAAYFQIINQLVVERKLRNIRFVGPRSDMFSFLPSFSQFIMVSRAQGCPNASLEAMASGLPVLANSDGGTAEQVLHGVTGYVTGSDRPQELADFIIALFQNEDLRKTLGDNARVHVRKNFSLDSMLQQYLQVL